MWDQKKTGSSNENTFEGLIRHGIAQIAENPGGLLMDITNSALSFEAGIKIISRLSVKRAKNTMIAICKKGGDYSVLKIKK